MSWQPHRFPAKQQEMARSQGPDLQPHLPLVAVPALSSSPWDVPGTARVTKGAGGVKALAGWCGPKARLSLMMEELPTSPGRLASAARSSGLPG